MANAAATATSLSSQLASIQKQLAENSAHADHLISTLTPEELASRPRQGGWCVVECIQHLVATTNAFLPPMMVALTAAPRQTSEYRGTLLGRFLAWFLEPPYRMKFRVVPELAPHPVAPSDLLGSFEASQENLREFLRQCRGLAIDHVKVASPADSRIKYNVWDALRVLTAHQRRHLWQAEQVVKHLH
ncbi:MAG TPA: DinB family protein [Terriglobales bacterium]